MCKFVCVKQRDYKMAVKFYLDKRPSKSGDYPIRVSISLKGVRALSTAGYNVFKADWHAETNRAAAKSVNGKGITGAAINLRIGKIQTTFEELELKGERLTTAAILDRLADITGTTRRAVQVTKEKTIYDYFDEFILREQKAGQWTDGTLQQWAAFRRHLEEFGGEGLTFKRFDEAGFMDFVSYLRDELEMGENTARKHYSNLRWFLNWCIRKGYVPESQISKERPKFKIIDKPVIFLTRGELMKLYTFQIPANGTIVTLHDAAGKEYQRSVYDAAALEKTRDLFCFCAFTSLRYSDMAKLRKADIIGDTIMVTTKKTNDSLTIELNDYSRAILEKYKDVEFPNGRALPVISNQKMNDYIKTLGELCEFNTLIPRIMYKGGQRVEAMMPKYSLLGTHAGRRTFICTALGIGIPPQVVMKWTGHSDYKAMKPYIDVAADTKAEKMQMFNELKK